MSTSPAKDLTSIGILSSDLRVSVRDIERAAERLGISPALVLNRISHFDGDQVEQIATLLRSGLINGIVGRSHGARVQTDRR